MLKLITASLCFLAATALPVWMTNKDKARQLAKKKQKFIFLNFSGLFKNNYMQKNVLLFLFPLLSITTLAQKTNRIVYEQCGTMQRLQENFKTKPDLKIKFEQKRLEFNNAIKHRTYNLSKAAKRAAGNSSVYTIPVVFHIVMSNPRSVTDRQVQAQLDTLNKDFAGVNGDSVRVPSYFKSFTGKSSIQFCLAQQTPDGESTSGVERITTTHTSFSINDAVKHSSSAGANIWSGDKYFNVWVCALSNNILGYATFPEDGVPDEQGVVIDYRSLPGGSLTGYNTGKTLTHETGHYFDLYHIWGDDDGACTGTDYVDDTPNQSNSSSTCYAGIRTDNCTPSGNGIMYQNYMDYTPDGCLVMFTKDQVERMETAFAAYRSSLLNSPGCQPPVSRNYDAQLTSINEPSQRICSPVFSPVITIKNKGIKTLTSLTIGARIDNGSAVNYSWTGNLARTATEEVNLSTLTAAVGQHILTVYVTGPDNNNDEDASDDTLSLHYQYYEPVKNVSEGFEGNVFPPEGWDIVNPDSSVTWKRTTFAKTGKAGVTIGNFDYNSPGQTDDLRLPGLTLEKVDSAFLSFNIAAAAYTKLNTPGNTWDTLEVLASTDCGRSYTSLYKKYGQSLVTRSPDTLSFTPAAEEWRKDSVNLTNYLGMSNVILVFRNTNGYENNIYLDDINIRKVTINPNLKRQGFLVTPNPTGGFFSVQFYPQPSNLRAIELFNMSGQKLKEISTNGQANNKYDIDISNQARGIYIVRVIFSDKVLMKKIMKL